MKSRRTLSLCRAICLAGCLAALGAAPPAQAQTATDFQGGVAAFEAGAYDAAVRLLHAVVEADSAFHEAGQGSAAYWLGAVYAARHDTARALAVWQAGLDALAGRLDPRLNDAYVRAAFDGRAEDAYVRAALAYLDLLEHAEALSDDAERRLVARHVAHLLMLWPEDQRLRLVEGGTVDDDGRLRLKPGAGPAMAAWWRGQDLELATPRNERLEEHLARVAHARRRYADADALTGFDDRGAVYVRLGEPDRREVVTYQDDRLLQILGESFTDVRMGISDMPKNEVWYYPSLDHSGLYVFVRQGGRYRLATPTDLIPRRLRMSGPNRAALKLVATMQYLSETLGAISPHYSSRYAGGVNHILIYQRLNRWYMDTSTLAPGTRLEPMLRSAIYDVEQDDVAQRRDRDEQVPQQHTELFDEIEVLPVAFRLARFLDADGTTRTELFWTHPPDTLLSARSQITLTAVQLDDAYHARARTTDRYRPAPPELDGDVYVHTRTLHGDAGRYHLHLQWNLHDTWYRTPEGALQRFTNVFKADTLDALDPDPRRLEMSDLLPSLDLNDGASAGRGLVIRPYPLPTLTDELSLALYFEVYHLAFGPDDLTRYTVAYEIERREQGGVWRFFRDKNERTVAASTYSGTSRTAQEFVVVDLSDAGDKDHLKITVRVTDDVTGRQTARSIEFDFAKASN